ncbi:hypothetical protein B7494_g1301 [Chlorociboria aeruginascens]|nr:hypothetical protein B7494_g1301 [Chlorociboria aeruginascens]
MISRALDRLPLAILRNTDFKDILASLNNGRVMKIKPADIVHIDQSPVSALDRLCLLLPQEEVEDLLTQYRVQIFNVWRPICDVVEDWPFAVCDARTSTMKDLVDFEFITDEFGKDNPRVTSESGLDAWRMNPIATSSNLKETLDCLEIERDSPVDPALVRPAFLATPKPELYQLCPTFKISDIYQILLAKLADMISKQCKILDDYIASENLSEPFNSTGPLEFPVTASTPKVIKSARSGLLHATKTLHDLTARPAAMLVWPAFTHPYYLSTLRTLQRLSIPEAVPLEGAALFEQIQSTSNLRWTMGL